MWRKALLITLIWFFVTSLLNAVLGSGISAFLNSGIPDSLGLTNGEFVMIYGWLNRIVTAGLFFLLIWWGLSTSVPQRKQKRATNGRQWFADEASEDNEAVRLHKLSDAQSDHSHVGQMMEATTNSDISQSKKGT